jgi:hypothetical protein
VKSRQWLLCCPFVLSLASVASADESLVNWAEHRIDEGIVKPLAKREGGSRFSRERPPPRERRVRVLASTLSRDKNGRSFVAFAIDVRFGSDWQQNDIVGCAYRESGNLFVKTGDAYRPATFLLGKNVTAVAGACEAAPPPSS